MESICDASRMLLESPSKEPVIVGIHLAMPSLILACDLDTRLIRWQRCIV